MQESLSPGTFPSGWYAVFPSSQLRPTQVESVHYFGRDMVLWRSESGEARLADAICPHLGANLGLGKVRGENLVCGMHGFEFGGDGQCVKLAYGTRPPPKARLELLPVHEINGFVYTYYSPDRGHPTWKLESLDWEGWTTLRHERLEFVGHPQDTTENSVDMGHFEPIHRYRSSVVSEPVLDDEKLTAAYRVIRPWFGPRLQRLVFVARFNIFAHGLGYSLVHATVEHTPLSIRYYINATPIDGQRVHMQIAASIRKIGIPGLNWLAREGAFRGLRHDVSQDIPFWQSKRHIERPLLAEGDGPIAIYRQWCRQFYPDESAGGARDPGPR